MSYDNERRRTDVIPDAARDARADRRRRDFPFSTGRLPPAMRVTREDGSNGK